MSYLELLWFPAVLGWIPLIYADELSARFEQASMQERSIADARRQIESPDAVVDS